MYDSKKIMKEIGTGEGEHAPAVRIDIVMDNVPESQQPEIERELRVFLEKISNALDGKSASRREPKGGECEMRLCYKDGKTVLESLLQRQTALERQFKDGLSGTTLILGACDIDEIVSVIEKRLTLRQLEKENR